MAVFAMMVVMAAGICAAREAAAQMAPASALDKPSFTATPAELLAAAKAAPAPHADTVLSILRDERDIAFDAHGRATERHRMVYVVRKVLDSDDRDDDWNGALGEPWHASFQDQPQLRARVIAPDGTVVEADPTPMPEPAWTSADAELHYAASKLPEAVVGAVVETEAVVRGREPRLGGGGGVFNLYDHDQVLSFSTPLGHPLHRVERALPPGIRARHEVAAGRERWIYDLPAMPATVGEARLEFDTPHDVITAPYVGVATAASWRAVARSFRAAVERSIADGPVVLPAALPHAATRAAVDQITAWMRDRPRQSPGEMRGARGSVVALSPPAATLTRGGRGGADRAVLLMALLRQAGIRSQLVLVGRIYGAEVDPDLPGMMQFSHAVVRARLGSGELWISPDESTVMPGQLPTSDQGRRALVIADDTAGLITTPIAPSQDNAIREVRSFTPAELGPSALTVVRQVTGAYGSRDRMMARFTGRRPKAGEAYGGSVTSERSSGADDFETAFTSTTEVESSGWVRGRWDALTIELPMDDLVAELPKHLRDRPKLPRVHDVAWDIAHVHEIENRIELPPGFAPPAPAADRVMHAGPATLEIRQRVEGRFLILTMRFDTGKPRWTSAELTAMQDALPAIVDAPFKLSIDRTAVALEKAGKLREAVAENARLIALHPSEALHHQHQAISLIAAGDGDGARREARAAVALEPGATSALVTLGWVLRHDRLGRDGRYDWDRAGALAALRKARALDSEDAGAAIDIASIVERSAGGELFGPGVDIAAAVEAWVTAHTLDRGEDTTLQLAQALLWAGKPIAAETTARSVVPSVRRDGIIVSAIAQTQGAPAALAEAARLRSGDELVQLLGHVTWWEMYMGHYDLARAAFAGNQGAKLPPFWTAALARLTPRRPVARPPGDPRGSIDELFAALLDPARKTTVFGDAKLESDLRHLFAREFADVDEMPPVHELLADALASETVQLDGDRGAWRARITGLWQPTTLYLALVGGAVRVIGTDGDNADGVGRHVLRLDLGDPAAVATARRLLDWQREDLDKDTERTAVLFRRVWGRDRAPTPAAITSAAAVLSVWSDEALTLARAAQCEPLPPEARSGCHETLAYAHARAHQWADAEREFTAARTLDPDARTAFLWSESYALGWAGQFDEADRAVDSVLAAHPDDAQALVARFHVAAARGDRAEAVRRAEAVAHRSGVTRHDLNEIAWNGVIDPGEVTGALALAHRAVDGAKFSYAYRNTLAALEAEAGELGAAVGDNRVALVRSGSSEPLPGDWYVQARIDEQIGEPDDAIAIYRRIARPDAERSSIAGLAARRLAALQQPKP